MNEDKKTKLIMSLTNNFPSGLAASNLAGNKKFADWFLPVNQAISESDFWEKSRLERIQSERLKNLFMSLSLRSSFWKRYFKTYHLSIDSLSLLEDLRRLPILDRNFLKLKNGQIVAPDKNNKNTLHTVSTSGTTGIPISIAITEREMLTSEWSCFFRSFISDKDSISSLLKRKFVFLLGVTMPQYTSFGQSFILDNFSPLSRSGTRKEIYEIIIKMAPVILWGYPSLIFEFAKYIKADRVALPFLAVYIHGESLTRDEYVFIRDLFKVPVIYRYVSREAGLIGTKCIENSDNYYHVHRERVIVEVVDEDGSSVGPEKEGNIVLTVLDRETTPIIRYDIGDRGRFIHGQCSCGRSSPLLEVRGRKSDYIIFFNGHTFSSLLFRSILFRLIDSKRIKQLQILQNSLSSLDVLIVTNGPLNKTEKDILQMILSSVLENKIAVNIKQVREIAKISGKTPVFVPLYRNSQKLQATI